GQGGDDRMVAVAGDDDAVVVIQVAEDEAEGGSGAEQLVVDALDRPRAVLGVDGGQGGVRVGVAPGDRLDPGGERRRGVGVHYQDAGRRPGGRPAVGGRGTGPGARRATPGQDC